MTCSSLRCWCSHPPVRRVMSTGWLCTWEELPQEGRVRVRVFVAVVVEEEGLTIGYHGSIL